MKAVRYVGTEGCSDAGYAGAIQDPKVTVVDTLAGGNVTVRFRCDGKPLQISFSPLSLDLVDLAVSVYITDEMERRSQSTDLWTRDHNLIFPVNDPSTWSRVTPILSAALKRVSGDRFKFTWLQRSELPVIRHRARLPHLFDAVCLFSGGIDSLLGAFHLLSVGKKVILLGHQADGAAAAAQSTLAENLRRLFPGMTAYVQCRVARALSERTSHSLPEKCEDTHRCRSFLFLSLAASVAASASVGEIYIPENGLIALNAPLQVSRIGTLSTRTAHPRFLSEFADFAEGAGIFNGQLKNPFLYQSKTDMLRGVDPRLSDMLMRSVSCSRPSRYQNLGVRHCGYCVPCVYRRVAMMECGLDRGGEYAFDTFQNLKDLSLHKQADFRALVRFARRLVAASDLELEMIVLWQGYFPPSVGARLGPNPTADYSPWTMMMKRWAEDFLVKVDSRCSAETRNIIGVSTPTAEARNR